MIEILTNNHGEKIIELFDNVTQEIKIISPFISRPMVKKLCNIVKQKKIKCTFITRIYLEDMLSKANSLDAIEMMIDCGICVYAVNGLHTKLYLFDNTKCILGSANFTAGGFKSNIELSIYFENENVIWELQEYFSNLQGKLDSSNGGLVTKRVINEAREKYKFAYSSKKEQGFHISTLMFGADIGLLNMSKLQNDSERLIKELTSASEEKDIVYDTFKEIDAVKDVHYDYNIWMKFTGTGVNRRNNEDKESLVCVELEGKNVYIANYSRKPSSVVTGDNVYIAPLSKDVKGKNQPIIIGRGTLLGFNSNNYVKEKWINEQEWMTKFPWYCVIDECDILDTEIKNGIPLDEIVDELGSNAYMESFGRNESVRAVLKKHHQKAHMRLSGNAKDYIDARFEKLIEKYGVKHYQSEKKI